ncbi:MAG TPA: zinc ribbon domain-containing protein [Ktedonobacteraceae bacterium]|nr:zinc ribbon domain-containing protein [Ktedonobacteraceae bacterium]
MPVYEYRCQACGEVFSLLFQSYSQAREQEPCSHCGSQQTRRIFSALSIVGKADPGPGRRAWPTSWDDTNGGDPETLRYWRKRIEHEARLEEKYPELRDPSLLTGKSEAESQPVPSEAAHSHEGHHHHHHHHGHEHPHPHSHSEPAGGSSTNGQAS